jgi:hypothetical protein
MNHHDPLSPRFPAILRGNFAFIGGGGSSQQAPQRNLTKELTDTLAGYQATAPGYAALNANPDYGQPFYAKLGLDNAATTQQGYTDANGVYHPGTTALGQEAATSNRASTLLDLLGFGPSATAGLFNANPFLANATGNSSNILDTLSKTVLGPDFLSGKMTPEEIRNASQATQAGFAARGIDNGNSSLITDVLNRDALTRARQQQNIATAGQVAGENLQGAQTYSSTVTAPLLQILGLGDITPGGNASSSNPTGGAISNANSLFNPTNPYAADVYNTNLNATAAQNIANQNSSAAGNAAILGLIGSIFSDERLKKKVKKIGKTPSGVPIKKWVYKHDPEEKEFVGGTAQDIEKVFPKAVKTDRLSGIKSVDYRQTDVPFGLVETLLAA